MKKIIGLIYCLFFIGCAQNKNSFELPNIISDDMILRSNSEVKIWGWADKGESIAVTPSWGSTIYTGANDRGEWNVTLKTKKAGGPFSLEIEARDTTVEIKNIMFGKVWLCSGQSNMEMPLRGWPPQDTINNSAIEIKAANYPDIRMFTVERNMSLNEQKQLSGKWLSSNPENVPDFSATAYFFGKELHESLNVPIGLIHSSWGGTPAESWISNKYIGSVKGFEDINEKLNNAVVENEKFIKWLSQFSTIKVENANDPKIFDQLYFDDSTCNKAEYDDNDWNSLPLPNNWERTELGVFDGVVWFRKKIEIPNEWLNKELIIELGPIDDMDHTYFNGELIGQHIGGGFWNQPRKYEISAESNSKQTATIAIRVIDTQGGGGIYGSEGQLKIYLPKAPQKTISLSGDWKYLPVAEYMNHQFYIYGENKSVFDTRPESAINLGSSTPTVLYNAMIAPITNYKIDGTIWYQGESNVGGAKKYVDLFSTLIKSWRTERHENFPFYFVQIAPFNYSNPKNSESGELRAAQFEVSSEDNVGIVSTLDIGDAENIHPSNKQDVGYRLALWALAKTYDHELVYSGPIYKSMKIEGNKIRLSFESTGSGLMLKNKMKTGFLVAGNDNKYYKAKSEVDGNIIIIYSEKVVKPVSVKYAWDNVPEASLFNQEGLPAPTFSTEKLK